MNWIKMLHMLSLGLWVGSSTFFGFFTALPIIARMRELASTAGNWAGFTDEKQGVRMAGEALDVVFARYFPWQVACGVVATLTGLLLYSSPGFIQKTRIGLLGLALGLATLNLVVFAPKVHEVRLQRYDQDVEKAKLAETSFSLLHNYSLICDMVTLLCAFLALALFAWQPHPPNVK